MDDIKHPIFYSIPIGIRFAIGDSSDVAMYSEGGTVDPSYVEYCVQRATLIIDSMPAEPDILAIEFFYFDEELLDGDISAVLLATGLPHPHETEKKEISLDDGDIVKYAVLCWDISSAEIDRGKILRQIVLSDIGGEHLLTASVFWLCSENNTMFHIYDDRGADLVASDVSTLKEIYTDLNDWILHYDRERIDGIFNS